MPNPKEIADKIEASLPEFEKLAFDAELLAAQTSLSLLLLRTYSGDGVHDTKNNALGKYSDAYAKRRESQGRQTKVKDLYLTGALFESIQVGTVNEKPATGFLTQRSSEIAGYQEEQNKTTIFALNDEERETVKNDVAKYTIEKIGEIVKGWF